MSQCLSDGDLDRYHARELPDEQAGKISAHLKTCPSCAQRAQDARSAHEALLGRLKKLNLSDADLNPPDSAPASGPVRVIQKSFSDDSLDAGASNTIVPSGVFRGYEIIREVHRGGQGVVYQAVQLSTKRKVAIKVLLEGPFASRAARRRFEREIELIAALKHPNIVAVFDSGATADGQSFCVMDYVSGVRLDHHVHDNKLPLAPTLELFAAICEVVNYAHQRGVIHRDLKPSNILVDMDGNPKVLDFGLAKQLSGPNEPLLSISGQIVGTLPYMSPEQARGKSDEIDIRTDVYSLGVLLYELLTGAYPYPVMGEMADVLRHITDSPPNPPSRSWKPDSGIVSRDPKSGAIDLKCPIDGEIETIIYKALSKERERRYQSALELSRDIRAYLAGEPVSAKRDSRWYIVKKTLTRHRGPVAVGAAFLILLAAWSVTASILWREQAVYIEQIEEQRQAAVNAEIDARRERDRAVKAENQTRSQRDRAIAAEAAAQRRFEQVQELAQSFIFDFHDLVADLPGATPAREFIVKRALTYLDALSGESAGHRQLRSDLAKAYIRVGDVQGGAGAANLGDTRGALASYRKAADLLEALQSEQPDEMTVRYNLGSCYHRMGIVYAVTGESDKALEMFQANLKIAEDILADQPADPEALRYLSICLASTANLDAQLGRIDAALAGLNRALDIDEKTAERDPANIEALRGAEYNLGKIGELQALSGRPDDALRSLQKALDYAQRIFDKDKSSALARRDLSIALDQVGSSHLAAGRADQARSFFEKALEHDRELAMLDPANLEAQRDLAISLQRAGDLALRASEFDQSREFFEQAHVIFQNLVEADPSNLRSAADFAGILTKLGNVHMAEKHPDQALRRFIAGMELRRRLHQSDPNDAILRRNLAVSYDLIGSAHLELRELEKAENAFRDALAVVEPLSHEDPTNAQVRRNLAIAYERIADILVRRADTDPINVGLSRARRTQAIDYFHKADQIYRDFRESGIATDADSELSASLNARIAACEEDLATSQPENEQTPATQPES